MKNDKHQQAKNLFFQTNLSKTEIANRLGVNRRTVMLWCQQGNWERLRQSAENMPSMVAEKCYFLLDHYTSHLLSSNAVISTFGPKEANAINQVATSIKKLKNRSAINEAMEMFNFFLEYIKKNVPEMHELVIPLVEGYIATRRDTNVDSFVPHNFTRDARMDETIREQQIVEQWKDEDDQLILNQEWSDFLQYREQKAKAGAGPDNLGPDESDNPTNHNITPDLPKSPFAPATTADQEDLGDHHSTMNAENIGCHGEPRRTMTAQNSTPVEEKRHNTTLTSTLKTEHFILPLQDIHTNSFNLPPLARHSFSDGGQNHNFGKPASPAVACHPELVEGCHPEPAEGHPELAVACHPELAEGHPEPVEGLAKEGRTTHAKTRTIADNSVVILSLSKDTALSEPLTPLQNFSLLTFLNAAAPKREPDCWSRHYKELKKIFPDNITTLEELDEIKFSPEAREKVLDILRQGYPIPGFEQLQLKLIHADIAKNKQNNNQNLAA